MLKGEFIQEVFLTVFTSIFNEIENERESNGLESDVCSSYEEAFRKASYLSNVAAIELESISENNEIWVNG